MGRKLRLIMFIIHHYSLSGLHYSGGEMMYDKERLAKAAAHNEVLRFALRELFTKS